MEEKGISPCEVAYMGDDVNDIECMTYVGLSACPADAVEEVKNNVDYVAVHKGGYGAVRELCDKLK